jgi:hypothetical protein
MKKNGERKALSEAHALRRVFPDIKIKIWTRHLKIRVTFVDNIDYSPVIGTLFPGDRLRLFLEDMFRYIHAIFNSWF